MWVILVINLLTLVVQAHTNEILASHNSNTNDSMDGLVDDLVEKLVQRTHKMWPYANLDNMTLAKTHLAPYTRPLMPVSHSLFPMQRSQLALPRLTFPVLPAPHSFSMLHAHGHRTAAGADGTTDQGTSAGGFATVAMAAAAVAAGALVGVPGRAERSRKKRMKTLARAGTVLPEVDPATTRNFTRSLRRSDQYYKFGKTQMEKAMDQLKSVSGSNLLRKIREAGFKYTIGDVTFVLAESYGFCWGVERSVAMAYEARNYFPDKNIWVTNEIIHNPVVNQKLSEVGMKFIQMKEDGLKDFSVVGEGDVVILPAFGASVNEMAFLKEKNARIVDTTCPWVNKVWTSVEKNKDKGATSIIHGTFNHEETIGTKSFADKYLVVKNMEEAEIVADYILNGGDRDAFLARFEGRMSPGFDPDKDLKKVGVANQTTMLKGETELIQKLLERTMIRRFGPELINDHFLSFNTICDATDERQDAMYKMFGKSYQPPPSKLLGELEESQAGVTLTSQKNQEKLSSADKEAESRGAAGVPVAAQGPIDMCLVVGGFNSANTAHLLEIAEEQGIPGYHIDGFKRIGAPGEDPSTGSLSNQIEGKPISTKPADAMQDKGLHVTKGFLPDGPVTIGVTSGASTPDNTVEECLKRILAVKGLEVPT